MTQASACGTMSRPLAIGAAAPPFSVAATDGRTWTEKDLVGAPHVLFFYPRDETPGCTIQAAGFRDAWGDFGALGVRVLGVSRNSTRSHERFCANHDLPFLLLSDRDGRMMDAFGATMFGSLPRRVSYLLDADARVVDRFVSQLRPAAHAARMLEAAARLPRA